MAQEASKARGTPIGHSCVALAAAMGCVVGHAGGCAMGHDAGSAQWLHLSGKGATPRCGTVCVDGWSMTVVSGMGSSHGIGAQGMPAGHVAWEADPMCDAGCAGRNVGHGVVSARWLCLCGVWSGPDMWCRACGAAWCIDVQGGGVATGCSMGSGPGVWCWA